ncbi:zf-HC2 domain-containing protein [Saccharospirillum sp.]|uniref:zf-HC2 domain-containing protein n=1 Tax=Saccharospirillum sp. TaxID=2033801 RepID=UPI0034A043AA
MMNCEQATRLMSDSRERELSIRERAAIKMHNLMCSGCRNFNVQVEQVGQMARRFARENDEVTGEPAEKEKDNNN